MSPTQNNRFNDYNPFDPVTQEYEKTIRKKRAQKIIVETLLALFLSVFAGIVFIKAGIGTESLSIETETIKISGHPATIISIMTFLGSYWKSHCWYSIENNTFNSSA